MNSIQLSSAFCSHNGVVILDDNTDITRIGMLRVSDNVLKKRIQKSYPDRKFHFESIDTETFNLKISRFFSANTDITVASTIENRKDHDRSYKDSDIDRLDEDAPLINLLNSIFLEAIARRASDIHIEGEQVYARIRFRIDGLLVNILKIPCDRAVALSSRLKLLSNLNVLENRKPQDGRIDIVSGGNALDVRISISPTVCGESIVLRLLNRSDRPLTLGDLGFCETHLRNIKEILQVSSGLVLVTGPTGSGKTTTLAAILRELNKEGTKIISIEDPVEYRIEGVTQVQINEELGLTFDALLRRVFRQDPDIIMIGEIRDIQTAELAIRAALTGHLVFATLHTNSAIDTIIRLQDMGIPPYLVASTLRAVIGQRLVRRICLECVGKGCTKCNSTGYRGRIVIAEIAQITKELSGKISENSSSTELEKVFMKNKYLSIREDAENKINLSLTTREEVFSELGIVL